MIVAGDEVHCTVLQQAGGDGLRHRTAISGKSAGNHLHQAVDVDPIEKHLRAVLQDRVIT